MRKKGFKTSKAATNFFNKKKKKGLNVSMTSYGDTIKKRRKLRYSHYVHWTKSKR